MTINPAETQEFVTSRTKDVIDIHSKLTKLRQSAELIRRGLEDQMLSGSLRSVVLNVGFEKPMAIQSFIDEISDAIDQTYKLSEEIEYMQDPIPGYDAANFDIVDKAIESLSSECDRFESNYVRLSWRYESALRHLSYQIDRLMRTVPNEGA